LQRKMDDAAIADELEIDVPTLRAKIGKLNLILLEHRSSRIKPGLDDKSLTSWNCLMSTGYLDAYQAFNDKQFLDAALKNIEWLEKNQLTPAGVLQHSYKNKKSSIDGFLEDYAFAIAMYVKTYEVTFDENYLKTATRLLDYVNEHFLDEK